MMPARAGAARARARPDDLRVGAGLRPPVDRAQHHAVAEGVEQRDGERQLARHLAQRVIADHREVTERPGSTVSREPMLPLIRAVHSATARARRCATTAITSTPTPGPATDGQCRSSQWWIRAT